MDINSSIVPVLPLRNAVLFPAISMPLVVGRERSLRTIEHAQSTGGLILILTQRVLTQGDPTPEDLFSVGTLGKIESLIEDNGASRQILVTGIARFKVETCWITQENLLLSRGTILADIHGTNRIHEEVLFQNLKEVAHKMIELVPGVAEPLLRLIEQVDDPVYLCHICSAYLNFSLFQKQDLLETLELENRMKTLIAAIQKEQEVLGVQKEIRDKMTERFNKTQRETILREQLKTIKSELGEESSEASIIEELEEKIYRTELPPAALKQTIEELKRLKSLPFAAAEYHIIRTYLDWILALPWKVPPIQTIDLRKARAILDEDHFGLEEVKKRIIQYLAVSKLKNNTQGPILCLMGPPGVGKTSLGHSIAKALGRNFIRTSLGGVRDEAEIRGHRRTYVGAMPGRILQSLKRAKSRNPVMLLDEIDKLRSDLHGDPSSALLEVLDPEQNKNFVDHYLDIPFDVSKVFFITTANMTDPIPPALKDRMEIIEMNGYTSLEKLHIAKRYLIPKLMKDHGLSENQIHISDEVIKKIISSYTREAGVRELERKIAALLRTAAEHVVNQEALNTLVEYPIVIDLNHLSDILGTEQFSLDILEQVVEPGVATGLAWTPHGGEILFIESKAIQSTKSNLILTGQLGEVMRESAQIAISLARTFIVSDFHSQFDFGRHDIHIHIPSGSIPKDGPSAGITLFSSLMSLVLTQPIDANLAMTGEITLRGAILPVGGIKEKALAAHRSGLSQIIIPGKNMSDIKKVPFEISKDLKFIFVDHIEELLKIVFGVSRKKISLQLLKQQSDPRDPPQS